MQCVWEAEGDNIVLTNIVCHTTLVIVHPVYCCCCKSSLFLLLHQVVSVCSDAIADVVIVVVVEFRDELRVLVSGCDGGDDVVRIPTDSKWKRVPE